MPEEPKISTEQRENSRYVSESATLSVALEDALCDLVEVHGIAYLDEFLARRIRRSVDDIRQRPLEIPALARRLLEQQSAHMEAVLRRVVQRVREDPSPAPR